MADKNKRKTLVIGHKNPDTDSICSAICYANLKQKTTGNIYEPARAGKVKDRKSTRLNSSHSDRSLMPSSA